MDENPDSCCETNGLALDPTVIRICGRIERCQLFGKARYEVLHTLSACGHVSRYWRTVRIQRRLGRLQGWRQAATLSLLYDIPLGPRSALARSDALSVSLGPKHRQPNPGRSP